jgi:hypothetical protein
MSPPAAASSDAALTALRQTEAAQEPVRFTGELQTDPAYYDGRLPHAVGVHHVQVHRASRARAPGFTYNHQPYLAWWRGRFYLQFLAAPVDEHEAPTYTFLATSEDGFVWSEPRVIFPEYILPVFCWDGVAFPAGMSAVMHQRMGFYVAPNGRLLTLGFYGLCPDPQHSPNSGRGVGRVVRELRADGSAAEIYFIRYNRHAGFDECNTAFPFYATSPDAEFRAACDALLADPLQTLQWWEEDRATDGFFAIDPSAVADGAVNDDGNAVTSEGAGKAFTWYTRPDGVIVGLWKNRFSALSPDGGRTWTPIVRNHSLRTTGSKVWGQRTSDGRYAIVYNHSATCVNRFPMCALIGDDGHLFDSVLCLQPEVPWRRFAGQHKGVGAHYFRGISENQPLPAGDDLWVAYSVNKEDLWVARICVPLSGAGSDPLTNEFGCAATIADLRRWNFHLPQWATSRLVEDAATSRRVLELRDEDPSDYASAERIFPAATRLRLCLRVQGRALPPGRSFEIEVQSQRHHRPVRLRFRKGWLGCDGGRRTHRQIRFALDRWYALELALDCVAGTFDLRVDEQLTHTCVPFREPAPVVERVVFRTGPWRGLVPSHLLDGGERPAGLDTDDLAFTDERVPPVVFWIDDLATNA